jgi:nucleotide-binding universal stress UspA family protein
MSGPERQTSPRKKILIALDASPRGMMALKVAVRLATESSADLEGLFVEDEDLVRLAALPFACEVEFRSSTSRPLLKGNMEQALQSAAHSAQLAFSSALQHEAVPWTFRIVRGTLVSASLEASSKADLLVIGQRGRSPRIAAAEYLPARRRSQPEVVVVFDGSSSAPRALELAAKVAEGSQLAVLLIAQEGRDVSEPCLEWLREHQRRAEIHQPLHPDQNTIVDVVAKRTPAILIVNRDSEWISQHQLTRLVDDFDCAVILC